MTGRTLLLFLAVFVTSALVTWLVRRSALIHGRLDVPNARSSHAVPTPRGGGLGIVVASSLALVGLWAWGPLDTPLFAALLGGGTAVAIVGYCDDRRSLPAGVRIGVHFASAIWAVAVLSGLPRIQWGSGAVDPGLTGDVLAVLGIVWTLNLFNFMDGLDGIAGSEAVFVTGAGGVLALTSGVTGGVPAACLVFAAATLGFLRWNWPPASIFMGDVGSGYLGYVLAVLALAATRDNAVMPFVWLILGGVFFTDATVTLLRRLARRERIFDAHRTHAYQRLAEHWRSHQRVTVVVWVANVIWLLPLAHLALVRPIYAAWTTAAALIPLATGVMICSAQRFQKPSA